MPCKECARMTRRIPQAVEAAGKAKESLRKIFSGSKVTVIDGAQ